MQVAVSAISAFLTGNDMEITLAVFDKNAVMISEKLFSDVKKYVDDNYVSEHSESVSRRFFGGRELLSAAPMAVGSCPEDVTLKMSFDKLDESFSEALLRMIDERQLTDAQVYKKANIDRRLFSKIRSDKNYKPKKQTVLAFAVALELDIPETKSLLEKAGFALSDSIKSDVIIKYFLSKKIYDIYEINETLFAFDQSLLGSI